MYIGICDDDKKYLEKLSDKVNRILSDRYVYTINAMMPEDLLTNIKEGTLPYDILLLDIDMGDFCLNNLSILQKQSQQAVYWPLFHIGI